jgi:hypothetical protein
MWVGISYIQTFNLIKYFYNCPAISIINFSSKSANKNSDIGFLDLIVISKYLIAIKKK